MTDSETWIRATACGDLADGEALAVPAPDGRTIALFFTDGTYYATDNQCPHMGFPLVRGLVRNGMVTCDWHGRSFEPDRGRLFPFAMRRRPRVRDRDSRRRGVDPLRRGTGGPSRSAPASALGRPAWRRPVDDVEGDRPTPPRRRARGRHRRTHHAPRRSAHREFARPRCRRRRVAAHQRSQGRPTLRGRRPLDRAGHCRPLGGRARCGAQRERADAAALRLGAHGALGAQLRPRPHGQPHRTMPLHGMDRGRWREDPAAFTRVRRGTALPGLRRQLGLARLPGGTPGPLRLGAGGRADLQPSAPS